MTHRLLRRGMPEHVRTLESIEVAAKMLPNAYVDGGHVIAQCLARSLIREARAFTLSILLGAGIPLFLEGSTTTQSWTLMESKSYPCGTVESHYNIPAKA